MKGRTWWLRPLAGVALLGVVVWQVGSGPFLDGVRSVDAPTLAAGVLLGVPVTVACAWRWHLVARELGLDVGLRSAVASCYRSQLLNSTLPGGVLGDVHRGVRHGRAAGDGALGLRSVVWERVAGQAVQVVLTAGVLLLLPSPLRSPALVAAVCLVVLAGVALARVAPAAVRAPGVLLASTVAVACHVATYLLAARAVGVTASPARLVPLALVVLLAMAVPLNVAGWGPREGVAAWLFGAAGLGVAAGVATAVAYGVVATAATLPGIVVLLAERSPRAVPVLAVGGGSHG